MNYPLRGKYLDDFKVGDVYYTAARTITEADVMSFAGLTGDYNPLHTNEEYAKEHMANGTRMAHGMLGVAVLSGLVNQTGLVEGTTLALMETHEKFLGPLNFGDTIMGEIHVTEVRPSKKPGRGIVILEIELKNQKDEVITTQQQVLLMMRKEA